MTPETQRLVKILLDARKHESGRRKPVITQVNPRTTWRSRATVMDISERLRMRGYGHFSHDAVHAFMSELGALGLADKKEGGWAVLDFGKLADAAGLNVPAPDAKQLAAKDAAKAARARKGARGKPSWLTPQYGIKTLPETHELEAIGADA